MGAPVVAAAAAETLASSCSRRPDPAAAPTYRPTYFTASEWAFVNSAVDRIIPAGGVGPGGVEAGVAEFIDRQLELPYGHGAYFYMRGPFLSDLPASLGYQLRHTPRELYRSGIAAADAVTSSRWNKTFDQLPIAGQVEMLKMMENGIDEPSGLLLSYFFTQLIENAKEGYFADPLYGGNRSMGGWTLIGFPGARADFTDWLDQAGKPYPYGPVSVNGATA